MKIGLLFGSFNPIHIGHLIIANYAAEHTNLEQVWMMVTPHNPFKEENSLLEEALRFEMVNLAVSPYPKIAASNFEFQLPRPSYTVDTLNALSRKYPENEFTLIIGGDNWAQFTKWKDYKEILNKYRIFVYPRLDTKVLIPGNLKESVIMLDSPVIDISSSAVRDAIRENINIRPYLPAEVFDFIEQNNLYR